MNKYPCSYVSNGVNKHRGEYWWKCTVCGATDWISYYSEPWSEGEPMRDCKEKKMKVIKAPDAFKDEVRDRYSIFLGGSTEMDVAENWQERISNDLSKYSDQLLVLNPCRDDWDESWTQDPTPGTSFHEQVKWETEAQEGWSDLIVYHFSPDNKSPTTLLNLGRYGSLDPHNVIVCCPPEFWRYGAVYMFCKEHKIAFTETYEDMMAWIENRLGDRSVY